MGKPGIFRAGTSGLVLAEPNKKAYPLEFQDKSRLNYYASRLNSIEINSSFYKIPRCQTYTNWASMVPDDFQFTVKLWKGVTHTQGLIYQEEELQDFMTAVDCLGTKKGCLLIQFPAGAERNSKKLSQLLQSVRDADRNKQWRLAVEFRHPEWYQSFVHDLLDRFDASLVLHDMPASATTEINRDASFVYHRFHGVKGDYRGSYEADFLKEKANDIAKQLNAGKDVYAYFNNTMGAAVANLGSLRELVQAALLYND